MTKERAYREFAERAYSTPSEVWLNDPVSWPERNRALTPSELQFYRRVMRKEEKTA